MKVEYDNERKVKDMTGFCIGVYKKARELLTYELPYELFPSNGTYDELVANVPEVKISYIGPLIFYVFLCNNWVKVLIIHFSIIQNNLLVRLTKSELSS